MRSVALTSLQLLCPYAQSYGNFGIKNKFFCYNLPTSRGGISWILVWLLHCVLGMVAARLMDITDS